MTFNQWFKKTFGNNYGDFVQDEALFVAWYSCKQEVLKLLKKESETYSISHIIEKVDRKI